MAVGQRVLEAIGVSRPRRLARVRQWWEQEHVFGYGLILPALLLIVGLVAYPFGMAIYFSLSDYWVGSPGRFIGLQNFRDVLGNEIFRQAVQNSFVFAGIAVALKTVLGIWLAMLLFRPLRFKRLVRAAVLLPWVIPTALSTRAREQHAPVRHAGLPGGPQRRQPRPGGGDLALPLPDAGRDGVRPASLHPEGMTCKSA